MRSDDQLLCWFFLFFFKTEKTVKVKDFLLRFVATKSISLFRAAVSKRRARGLQSSQVFTTAWVEEISTRYVRKSGWIATLEAWV